MATSSLMDTQDLEREYSPSSCIGGDYRPFIDAYRTESHTARQRSVALGAEWSSPRYGLGAAQRMDLCVPASQAASGRPLPGLLVFIHGGYWQELSAQESLFAAANCVERGLAFAAIDYTHVQGWFLKAQLYRLHRRRRKRPRSGLQWHC